MKYIWGVVLLLIVVISGCNQEQSREVIATTTQTTTQASIATTKLADTTVNLPSVKEFTIEGDDNRNNPDTITVNKGDKVRITFKTLEENVYYGGLDWRSSYFNTGKIKPGDSKGVEFTADKTFTYTSYWPSSNVRKADGRIIVV